MLDLITVIIPTHNRPEELKRSINSVLNQTYQNFEILVVDDFSEEDIKEVVISFNDNRVKYFRLAKKGNANVARNLGIKEAKGEYIAMLDSDDEFLPIHLERRLKKIKEWNCDGIFGSAYILNGKNKQILHSRPLRIGERMINYLLSDGSATTPSHFYEKKCAENINWDESLYRHQDYDFTVKFSEKYKFCNDPKITILINANRTKKLSEAQFKSTISFIKKYKDDINPVYYAKYTASMQKITKQSNLDKKIKYFKKELNKNIHFISLNNYLSAHIPKNKLSILFLRIKFATLNLFVF